MKNLLTSILLSILFITNCEDPNNSDPELGICRHTYEDPILSIESVSAEQSGDPITKVEISDLMIDGTEYAPSSLTDEPAQNVSVQDSSIICTLPCGFGTRAGTYAFTASAENYQDTTLTFENVNYEVFNGGCPSSNSGSEKISFELKQQ